MSEDPSSPHEYGAFYLNVARYPELGSFRRFGAYLTKKAHDDTCEFFMCLADLNKELANIPELGHKSILNCPMWLIREKCPEGNGNYDKLYDLLKKYDESLVKHGMTAACID